MRASTPAARLLPVTATTCVWPLLSTTLAIWRAPLARAPAGALQLRSLTVNVAFALVVVPTVSVRATRAWVPLTARRRRVSAQSSAGLRAAVGVRAKPRACATQPSRAMRPLKAVSWVSAWATSALVHSAICQK